jgi:hypothetical protein
VNADAAITNAEETRETLEDKKTKKQKNNNK